jgi:hypothetical protein
MIASNVDGCGEYYLRVKGGGATMEGVPSNKATKRHFNALVPGAAIRK